MPASLPTASQPTTTVYTKTAWADAWVEQPLLGAIQLSMQAAPAHPSAVLWYRYGKGLLQEIGSRPADSTPATIARGGYLGKYVKISVSGLGDWYGVITDNSDTRKGELPTAVPSGVEQYTAFGLTWFLDQVPILKSKVKYSGGTQTIDRVIPFNGGTDGSNRPNRVTWKNYDSTSKCFTDRSQTTTPLAWKAKHAVEYILDNFAPVNAAGSVLIPFGLHASALTFLDYEIGRIEYAGKTPWQVLNQLIDRTRTLGWHVILDSGTLKVKVWSQTPSIITLPSGSSIPANPDLTDYDFDAAVNIQNAVVGTTLMAYYDQIIVLGERAGSVFSIRPQTNFEKDWTTADVTKYNAGASGKSGYSSLADSDKEAANQDVRASDPLARVFSWWKPNASWNGRSATDPVSGTAPYVFPTIDADGETDTAVPAHVQRAALRVQTYMPLRQGVDYTKPITPDRENDDTAETDFLPPMLLLQVAPIRSTPDAGWVHCERLNQSIDAGSTKRGYEYSVDLAVREDAPGVILRTAGAPQHFIAKELFVSQGEFEDIPTAQGINHDKWIATVYMQQDNYCRAQYPLQDDLPSLDLVRQLVIRVGGAFLDYIVPGTIVSVDAGELKKTSLGGWLRDDRDKLRDIARLAFAWYGQERRILNLSFRGITTGFEIGHLIETIGSGANLQTINTCITCVSYDLQAGTTQLHTQFGELDFTTK
jgi:hypothetical protein